MYFNYIMPNVKESELFYLNNLVKKTGSMSNGYKDVLNDTADANQLLIFKSFIQSYFNIKQWSLGNDNQPLFINDLSNGSNLNNNQIIYLNRDYRVNDLDNYDKISNDTSDSNQNLIFTRNIKSYFNLKQWAYGNDYIKHNVPSVQDALFGTIDISFCSGPDGYNSNTVGILLDLSGNQFPIDNSGITYSNDNKSPADVMLYTRNTNEIYVRCKSDSSYNGYYLYSSIFNISRTDPSTNSTKIFNSSRNSDISNAYLTTSTKTSDLSEDSFISTSDVYNPVSNYELKFSGLDISYNYFVREKYFFIQADARCLSGNLYDSCLINLSPTPQRIGVISLA